MNYWVRRVHTGWTCRPDMTRTAVFIRNNSITELKNMQKKTIIPSIWLTYTAWAAGSHDVSPDAFQTFVQPLKHLDHWDIQNKAPQTKTLQLLSPFSHFLKPVFHCCLWLNLSTYGSAQSAQWRAAKLVTSLRKQFRWHNQHLLTCWEWCQSSTQPSKTDTYQYFNEETEGNYQLKSPAWLQTRTLIQIVTYSAHRKFERSEVLQYISASRGNIIDNKNHILPSFRDISWVAFCFLQWSHKCWSMKIEWASVWNLVQSSSWISCFLNWGTMRQVLTSLWKTSNDTLAVAHTTFSSFPARWNPFLPSCLVARERAFRMRANIPAVSDSLCQTSAAAASYAKEDEHKSTAPTEGSGDGIMITN